MKINKNLMSINHTARKRNKSDIQWIVVHYVGALGDAKANTDYYKSTYVGASADFFVGFTGDIWQANDYYNYYSWHCGGGYQSTWTQNGGGQFYGQCTNSNSVGIEMCVHKRSTRTMNATDTDWYFEQATIESTAWLVAYLMSELNIDINHVIRHYEVNRKICGAPFVHNYNDWLQFKQKVANYAGSSSPVVAETQWYRVGTAWTNGQCQGQLGAYQVKENAINNCPAGYKVFDSKGNVIHEVESVGGTHSADFNGLTEAQCAAKILEMARADGHKTGILPSVTAAQMILESGYARTTELVKKADNAFGMKVTLSGNTWNSVWDGVSKVNIRTPEEYTPGVITYIYADFRKYPNLETSMEDHGRYLLGAMNGSKKRYDGLTKCTNYRQAITLVKNGGYATDSQYVSKICSIIERYGLDKYDAEIIGITPVIPTPDQPTVPVNDNMYRVGTDWSNGSCVNQIGAYSILDNAKAVVDSKSGYKVYNSKGEIVYEPKATSYYRVCKSYSNGKFNSQVGAFVSKDNAIAACKTAGSEYGVYDANGVKVYPEAVKTPSTATKDIYVVRRTFDEVEFQLGAFSSLENAKKQADANWLYKVFNLETKKVVYEPTLSIVQKFIGSCIRLDQWMQLDNKLGFQWRYYNSKRSENTFWKTRAANKRYTNCQGAVAFALKDIGITATSWYGSSGKIVYTSTGAEEATKKVFDIIPVKTKTVKQCIADGTLQPGDIVMYMAMAHTNVYLGNNLSLDSGHAFANGSGEGAPYTVWCGKTPYLGYKISYILRLKSTIWRVRCGKFSVHDNAINLKSKLLIAGFDAEVIHENGEYVVQAGKFSIKSNATTLKKKLKAAGFDVEIDKM